MNTEGVSAEGVSVITPTYNRANTLTRVYDGLLAQSNRNFEWIVVDDGSTDNTRELIADLKKEAPFEIHYFYKENGGQCAARNLAVKNSNKKFIMFNDSDDTLTPNAVEYGLSCWEQLETRENGAKNYWQICGRCVYENGELVGEPFLENFNQLPKTKKRRLKRRKYNIDCASISRTDILKNHPFPEPKDLKNVREDTVWSELHALYECYYVNHPFTVYYWDQDDQLSKRGYTWAEVYRRYLYNLNLLNRIFEIDKSFTLYEKWITLVKFLHTGVCLKKSFREIYSDINRPLTKSFAVIFYLPIYLLTKALRREVDTQSNI